MELSVQNPARQLYPRCPMKRRLGGPQHRFGLIEEEEHFFAVIHEFTRPKNI
jgi:hypothetical protein